MAEADDDSEYPIAIGPEVKGGQIVHRQREDGSCQAGVLMPLSEGRPMLPGAELVDINKRGDRYTMRTVWRNGGPAQVASPAYREGWDRIFGKEAN